MAKYVTTSGLQIPTVESLLSDVSTEQRADIDPNLNTDPDSPLGEMNGIFCSHLREAWEVLAMAYNGTNPDDAEGALLENVSAITGTVRRDATKSRFTGTRKVQLNCLAGFTIEPGGLTLAVLGKESIRFVNTDAVTAASDGAYFCAFEAEDFGPITCNAGTLTVVATPVFGLVSATNAFDAIVGKDVAKDPELRTTREIELRAQGAGTVDALRADILGIELEDESKPIVDCTVFNNESDGYDSNGLPPHSMECLVFDGVSADCPDDTIAQQIWDSKPGGIEMVGSTSGNATDSLGFRRLIRFSRPTISDLKIEIDIDKEADTYAGDATVQAAVAAKFAAEARQGGLIRCMHFVTAALGVSGAVDVLSIKIARSGDPYPASFTNLQLAAREMATLSAANVTVL